MLRRGTSFDIWVCDDVGGGSFWADTSFFTCLLLAAEHHLPLATARASDSALATDHNGRVVNANNDY